MPSVPNGLCARLNGALYVACSVFGQALKHECQFLIEWFTFDKMLQLKKCAGITAIDQETDM